MSVGILVVSHSARIADGVVELAEQMAPDVAMVAAGGTDDGGIGTSFDTITRGIETLSDAPGTDGIVVLCDLGSAYLTTDTALEFLNDDLRARVVVSSAPLVEGAVAGAVAAQTGGSVTEVVAATERAGVIGPAPGTLGAAGGEPSSEPVAQAQVSLVNPSGLHARPAAQFVRAAAGFAARVTVNGVDATSLLSVMALGLPQGATLDLRASGADAAEALEALEALVRSGFGE